MLPGGAMLLGNFSQYWQITGRMKNLTLKDGVASLLVTLPAWHLHTIFYLGLFSFQSFINHHQTPEKPKLAPHFDCMQKLSPEIAEATGESSIRQGGQFNWFSLPSCQFSLLIYFKLRDGGRGRSSCSAAYIHQPIHLNDDQMSTWERNKNGQANTKPSPQKPSFFICFWELRHVEWEDVYRGTKF